MYNSIEKKREYERNWYKTKGKQSRLDANKKWEDKKREEFKKIKASLKCEKCGETHIACLEFHHLEPNKKEGNVGQLAIRSSTKKLLEEIAKCTILCANCHRKEHYKYAS